jgi:fructokinase
MPRMAIVVVTGEALVDLVLSRDGSLAAHPGGGPYNVARTIGRLEQPVAYLGRVSSDRFGARLREELDADGVAADALVATDAPTTLALAELDAHGSATYRFYAEGTSVPGLTVQEATAAFPDDADVLYVGTLGLIWEPIATTLETLVARMPQDVLVALDPNCRPTEIDDPAAYSGRLARIMRRTDVVKASEEDLAWLSPGVAPVDAMRELVGDGRAVALLTLGGEGALVVTGEDVTEVKAPAVEVVDTIGAGDAFMGGFLAWWGEQGLHRDDLADSARVGEAARFACRVAAITCSRAGADPPRTSEL